MNLFNKGDHHPLKIFITFKNIHTIHIGAHINNFKKIKDQFNPHQQGYFTKVQ